MINETPANVPPSFFVSYVCDLSSRSDVVKRKKYLTDRPVIGPLFKIFHLQQMMSAIISLLGKYRSVLIAVKYHNYGFFVGIWNQNSLKKKLLKLFGFLTFLDTTHSKPVTNSIFLRRWFHCVSNNIDSLIVPIHFRLFI